MLDQSLTPSQAEQLEPALSELASMLAEGVEPTDPELEMLLLWRDLSADESWALDELRAWTSLLQRLRRSESSVEEALRGLTARGVSEPAARAAVESLAPPAGGGTEPAAAASPAAAAEAVPAARPSTASPLGAEAPVVAASDEQLAGLPFGTLVVGETAERRLVVRGGPGRITVDNPGVEVLPAVLESDEAEILVRVRPSAPGDLFARLRFEANSGQVSEVYVSATAALPGDEAAEHPAPVVPGAPGTEPGPERGAGDAAPGPLPAEASAGLPAGRLPRALQRVRGWPGTSRLGLPHLVAAATVGSLLLGLLAGIVAKPAPAVSSAGAGGESLEQAALAEDEALSAPATPTPRPRLAGSPRDPSRGVPLAPRADIVLVNTISLRPSRPSGRDRFGGPTGVALDSAGNVYVVELSGRIRKLNPEGEPLARWGGAGSEPGRFDGPMGIALDQAGNVYVADTGNHCIQKLSPDGQPLARWGTLGSAPGQFNSPQGVALDASGNVYVADTGNNRVQKLSPDGEPLAQWGRAGTAPGQFNTPSGLAVDRDGNVYVADTGNHRIQVLSVFGQPVLLLDTQPAKPRQFSRPVAVALGQQHLYVVDRENDLVQQFSLDGRLLAQWGHGEAPVEDLNEPSGLAVDARGFVWVADTRNGRLQQLEFGAVLPSHEPAATPNEG